MHRESTAAHNQMVRKEAHERAARRNGHEDIRRAQRLACEIFVARQDGSPVRGRQRLSLLSTSLWVQ